MVVQNKYYWNVLILTVDINLYDKIKSACDGIEYENKFVKTIKASNIEEAKDLLDDFSVNVLLINIADSDYKQYIDFVRYVRKDLQNNKISINFYIPKIAPKYRKEIFNISEREGLNFYIETYDLNKEQINFLILSAITYFLHSCSLGKNITLLKTMISAITGLKTSISDEEFLLLNLKKMKEILESDEVTFIVNVTLYNNNHFIYSSYNFKYKTLSGVEFLSQFLKEPFRQNVIWQDNSVFVIFTNPTLFAYVEFKQPLFPGLKQVLSLYFQELIMSLANIRLRRESEESLLDSIAILSELIENRSQETGTHVKRVMEYTGILSSILGFDRETSYIFRIASMTHDIGKIGIPDAILNKPGKLTKEEFDIMKKHSKIGYDILKNFKKPLFKVAKNIALYHHENWDGTGYPTGIKGEEIPIEARIVSLVDFYDALGSDRVYRKAWEEIRILNLIKEIRGEKFDPKIVDAFFDNYHKILAAKMKFLHKRWV